MEIEVGSGKSAFIKHQRRHVFRLQQDLTFQSADRIGFHAKNSIQAVKEAM
jgi:hypothetical protein